MHVRFLAATAAILLTTTACGSGADDAGLPELSSTPSATQSTTGTLLDAIPTTAPDRPKDLKSDAGAKTFAAYTAQVILYTLETNDSKPLFAMADTKLCATCKDVKTAVEKRAGENKAQVGDGPLKVVNPKVAANTGGFFTVKQQVRYPSGGEINNKTGKMLETFPPETREMNVNMQWRKGAWTLLDYSTSDYKGS